MNNNPRGFINTKQETFVTQEKRQFKPATYIVNTDLLYDGQVFKNFKELVTVLGWKYHKSKSNASIAQQKALDAVCRWSYDMDETGKKRSNKVIIHEVYEVKRRTVDLRKTSNKTLLSRLISRSILEVLAEHNQRHPLPHEDITNTNKMYITVGGLFARIGLVNEAYLKGRHNQMELSDQLNLPIQHVHDFYALTHESMNKTLFRSLDQLKNQRLVHYRHAKRLVFKSIVLTEASLRGLNENKTVLADVTKNAIYSTLEQELFIFHSERQILSQRGFSSMSEIYSLNKKERQKFFNEVVAYIHNHCSTSEHECVRDLIELDYYYSALELSFYSPAVEMAVRSKGEMSSEERQGVVDYVMEEVLHEFLTLGDGDYRDDINQEHLKKINTNAKARHNKALKSPTHKDLRFKRDEVEYVDNFQTLSNSVVNQHSKFELSTNHKQSQVAIKTRINF